MRGKKKYYKKKQAEKIYKPKTPTTHMKYFEIW
ncbi:hypothetical protein T4B_3388 [Trichinella pseudospiralis]|uniref:Uncharacterized protein n=1 Tax=Trichinella pseudospiralis TaxID=6337 RepID=A0A0V1GC59_TRIPS|nr:hypothetical protein T4B_12785 [Trichinella pseudospiralis]KRY95306.1 hypothetical protein T4B_15403 [Trichinella pseudospiralis]KRY95701.1 hypothetical protein T4B_3388 [Trichinella pseudospiralis]